MSKRILHITDFHLNNFEGDSELIRRRYFEEYIDKLTIAMNANGVEKIDLLVLTGDFVDIGKVENFEHVKKIIAYICTKLNISVENVCCTIGNHDYKWKEENDDFKNSDDLRKPFYDFVEEYNNNVIIKDKRFFLKKIDSETFFLSLDSTLYSSNGAPGNLDGEEIDIIIHDTLKAYLKENSTLLIGCHFPVTSDPNNFLSSEEPNWHENHVWIQASALNDRIKGITLKNTIWFHGDVHASDNKIIESNTYILTGRFSGDINKVSEFPRQCVILEVNGTDQRTTTYNYKFVTHKANSHTGSWESSKLNQIREVVPTDVTVSKVLDEPSELKVIDLEIETQIMDTVSNDNLLKFGRFKTSEKYSSLGWINVNKLMSSPVLLSRINEKSFKHINGLISIASNKVILIGLEVIGGIIASQVSVRTNTRNFIYPIRGNKKFYSTEETNTKELDSILPEIEEVVIFIDVIASGNTMSEFISTLRDKNGKLKIHVISIITNNIHFIKPNIVGINSYATFCNKLKIPLVENQHLPEESIFQSTLDFT
jgi:orotate phosphoribosyltransferase